PGPKQKWPVLVGQVEAALSGQRPLGEQEPLGGGIVEKIRQGCRGWASPADGVVAVRSAEVSLENAREAGPVHVGHQMWRRLGLEQILRDSGLSAPARWLSEAMVLNRLIAPCSEHAMPEWIERTALGGLLVVDFSEISDEALYRNLDRLYPNRERIETARAEGEKPFFNRDESYYVYE